MTSAAEIAYQLGLTESRKGYTGFCPSCCYEKGFSVVDKDGRTLFHCHAGGCTQEEILQALREYGLWGNEGPKSVEFPIERSAPSHKPHNVEAAREMWTRGGHGRGKISPCAWI